MRSPAPWLPRYWFIAFCSPEPCQSAQGPAKQAEAKQRSGACVATSPPQMPKSPTGMKGWSRRPSVEESRVPCSSLLFSSSLLFPFKSREEEEAGQKGCIWAQAGPFRKAGKTQRKAGISTWLFWQVCLKANPEKGLLSCGLERTCCPKSGLKPQRLVQTPANCSPCCL